MLRRTKIVCTIGPASRDKKILSKLLKYTDVFRINFSHGTHEEHREDIERLRAVSAKAGKVVAVMQDIPGPKLRIGRLSQEPVILKKGDVFRLVGKEIVGGSSEASVNYPEMLSLMKEGDTLYLADGLIRMKVRKSSPEIVECIVVQGGLISSGKGISFSRRQTSLKYPTEEDIRHIKFGLDHSVDLIALSFVRSKEDVDNVRDIVGDSAYLIAKIETRNAVDNLHEIVDASDGVMVARGDLGVEVSIESVPELQEKIIGECMKRGKPSIVATQMLESMVSNPVPTRAEVTDISTAVKDGADALLLSDETAVGKYPARAAMVLRRIASYAERRLKERTGMHEDNLNPEEAVSRAACILATYSGAKAIVTPTQTGATARRVSMFRPSKPIVALCTDEHVMRRLCIVWGVLPVMVEQASSTDELLDKASEACARMGIAKQGEYIVVTSGTIGVRGSTNMLKIMKIS